MEQAELIKARTRGEKAGALLGNETLQAAFRALELSLTEELIRADDLSQLQAIHSDLKAIGRIREKLQTFVNAGKIARQELDRG